MLLRDDALGGHDVRPLCLEDSEPHREDLGGRHDGVGCDTRQRGLGACDHGANTGSGNGGGKQEANHWSFCRVSWRSDSRWWYLQVVLGWLSSSQFIGGGA